MFGTHKPYKISDVEHLSSEAQEYARRLNVPLQTIYQNYQEAQSIENKLDLTKEQITSLLVVSVELIHHQAIKVPINNNIFRNDYALIQREGTLHDVQDKITTCEMLLR